MDAQSVDNLFCLLEALRNWHKKVMVQSARAANGKPWKPVPFEQEMYSQKIMVLDIPKICDLVETEFNAHVQL